MKKFLSDERTIGAGVVLLICLGTYLVERHLGM